MISGERQDHVRATRVRGDSSHPDAAVTTRCASTAKRRLNGNLVSVLGLKVYDMSGASPAFGCLELFLGLQSCPGLPRTYRVRLLEHSGGHDPEVGSVSSGLVET